MKKILLLFIFFATLTFSIGMNAQQSAREISIASPKSDDGVLEAYPNPAKDFIILKSKDPNLKIKINGHICCNTDIKDVKLSSKRAQAIYTYLIEKNILFARVFHEGFGSSKPVYKIPEKNDSEKLANRRVEILILEK